MRSGYLEVGAKDAASEGAPGCSVRASIDGWHETLALTRLIEKT